jgi:ABC-type multidrug transport system fused ATPase/permease subunit
VISFLTRTLRYLRPYKRLVVYSVILILIGSGLGLLGPWPLAFLVDTVLTKGGIARSGLVTFLTGHFGVWIAQPASLIILAACASLLVTVLENVFAVIDDYVHTKLDLKMALDFRSEMFQHALELPLARHEERKAGMVIYVVNSFGDAVPQFLMVIPGLVRNVFTLIGMLWISLMLDWQLALLALTVVPFLYYSVGYYVKHIQEQLYTVKALEGESLSIIHEALSMIRVIVTFGGEGRCYRRFRSQSEVANDARLRLTVKQTVFSLAVETTTAIGSVLVLAIGAFHVLEGRLTVGQLLVILSYIASVYKPLEEISSTIGSLQDTIVSLRIAYDFLDSKADITDAPNAHDIQRSRGEVSFDNVSFSYAGRRETLINVSFKVRPGQIIGVVGPTGAGKTTLVSLLPRLYEAKHGRILLDGVDIRSLTLKSLRQQVSVVLQDPLLFSGTIEDNIRYGRPEASLEEVVEAARAANAHDFIMQLPEQYSTELGERGVKLSGGERQRISVARAFLKNAPILILDEPTSSIDSRTEAVILDALDRHMEGRTTFMIAHRLSTIRRADAILVFDHGKLVEAGTHDHLMEMGGLYSRLYMMQQSRTNGRRDRRR